MHHPGETRSTGDGRFTAAASTPPAMQRMGLPLAAVATLAVVVPSVLVLAIPAGGQIAAGRLIPLHRASSAPRVEPMTFRNVSPDDARRVNAAIPFDASANPPARPFRFVGTADAQTRATDCLSAAMLYEAGDDPAGERAVGQVVINRVRHPAFPKTICGVVFEGSDRTTGCQFTFTCDGALVRRRWPADSWERARAAARATLGGAVFPTVGYATHYHTDWVVPYWSASLDKVAAVHSHLFYRWSGWWGTPAAFRRRVSSDEPVITALTPMSAAYQAIGGGTAGAIGVPPGAVPLGTTGSLVPGQVDSFGLTLDRQLAPDQFAGLAIRICGARDYCKIMAWRDAGQVATRLPLQQAQIATMAFSYLRDRAQGYDKALWDCSSFPRADPRQCMKHQLFLPAEPTFPTVAASGPAPAAPIAARTVLPLSGVRRRSDQANAATGPIANPVASAVEP